MNQSIPNQKQALTYAIIAVLLWSTVATAFKISLRYFSPVEMVLYASITACIVLLIIVSVQGKLPQLLPQLKQRPLFYLMLGAINPFIYYLVLFKAYDLLPASQAQSLNYTWSITLTLLSVPFLGQKIRGRDWFACGFGYLGVLIIATKGDPLALQFDNPYGVGLALLSTVLWASYWIINTRNRSDPIVGILLAFLLSLPLSIAACWYSGAFDQILEKGFSNFSPASLAAIAYVGLFEMGVTFVLWLLAMKKAENTARISSLIFISPFVSLMLLSTILDEQIHGSTIIGLLLIVCGLLIQNRKQKI